MCIVRSAKLRDLRDLISIDVTMKTEDEDLDQIAQEIFKRTKNIYGMKWYSVYEKINKNCIRLKCMIESNITKPDINENILGLDLKILSVNVI